MRQACVPLGALLLLSWTLLVTMEPQRQEVAELVVEVPGGEGLRTSFSCRGRVQGYYADVETGCRLYHLCDDTGRQFTHACPNLTLFQQRMMICDHWYMVNCSASVVDYAANLLLGQRDQPFLRAEDHLHQQHRQYQKRQRTPLPVQFPYSNGQEEEERVEAGASDESEETSTAKYKSLTSTGRTKSSSSSSSKRKSPVNSSKTLSFSITSLPFRGNSERVSSEEDQYSSQGRVPESPKGQRRPSYTSGESSRQRGKSSAERPTSTATVSSFTSQPREHFSISSLPTAASVIANRGRNLQLDYETSRRPLPVTTSRTVVREPTPFRETSSLSPFIRQTTERVNQNYGPVQVYQGTQPFETSSPRTTNVQRASFNPEIPVLNSFNTQTRYAGKTNPILPTAVNLPDRYKNNPYFQDYFRSSSTTPSSLRPPVVVRTTTPFPPFQPVYNTEVGNEDEDEHSGNKIEITLQDPRWMFFIPDSDFDLDSSLNSKNSTVLVIPLPAPSHQHGAMRFRSDDRLIEGRNPQCPRCHPAFLFPGQCQPCVLIR